MVRIIIVSMLFLMINNMQASNNSNVNLPDLTSYLAIKQHPSTPRGFEKIITRIETKRGSDYFAIVTKYITRPEDFTPDTEVVELTTNEHYKATKCQGIEVPINLSDGRTVHVLSNGTVHIEEK